MNKLKFTKKENGSGTRVKGVLAWGSVTFNVISGGFGLGPLPNGKYTVEKRKVAVGNSSNMKSGFINPNTNVGWFIPITPLIELDRHGFGIHPDGNKPGTKGCIGLVGNDIEKFWKKWLDTPIATRPEELIVESEVKL